MAHKKAAGSAKNLRDSQPKFRGVKIFGGQIAKAGNIIVRQCGNKYEAGKNVYVSNDFSIHANVDGVVRFSKTNKVRFDGRKYLKTVVNVDPCDITSKAKAPKAKKPVAAKVEKPVAKAVEKTEKKVEEKVEKKATAAKKSAEKKPAAKKEAPAKKAPATKKPAAKKVAK